MKFVLLFGPQAVGKMTVGHELEKVTDLKLFHNHMTIELVAPFFSYGTEAGQRLVKLFREEMLEEIAKSDLYGVIFTYVWALDMKEDESFVEEICKMFEEQGASIYFVELEADLDERIARNKTEHRLLHKPTKRDIAWSENDLIESTQAYRLQSLPGEITRENYIRINNTNKTAEEVALMIKEAFSFA